MSGSLITYYQAFVNERQMGGYDSRRDAIRALKLRMLSRRSPATLKVVEVVVGQGPRLSWEARFRSGKIRVVLDDPELTRQAETVIVVPTRPRPSALA